MPSVPQKDKQRLDYSFWKSDTYSYVLLPGKGGSDILAAMQNPWEVRSVQGKHCYKVPSFLVDSPHLPPGLDSPIWSTEGFCLAKPHLCMDFLASTSPACRIPNWIQTSQVPDFHSGSGPDYVKWLNRWLVWQTRIVFINVHNCKGWPKSFAEPGPFSRKPASDHRHNVLKLEMVQLLSLYCPFYAKVSFSFYISLKALLFLSI